MKFEELKDLVLNLLKDKFQTIEKKLITIEKEVKNMYERFDDLEQKYKEDYSYRNKISELENYLRKFQNDLIQSSMEAKMVLENTEKKMQEIEILKTLQMSPLQNLQHYQSNQSTLPQQQQQFQSNQSSQQNQEIVQTQQVIQLAVAQQQVQRQQEEQIFTTVNRKRYHRGTCEWLKYTKVPITRTDAQQEGIPACLICKP